MCDIAMSEAQELVSQSALLTPTADNVPVNCLPDSIAENEALTQDLKPLSEAIKELGSMRVQAVAIMEELEQATLALAVHPTSDVSYNEANEIQLPDQNA